MINDFHPETPQQVRVILNELNQTHERVRVFYGNQQTGEAWPEEFEVLGYIGRSTGTKKIPLLISNSRALGGGALSDHRIVAIFRTTGHKLYAHPNFNVGKFESHPDSSVAGYSHMVTHNGEEVARFKNPQQAARWIEFMQGKRFSKG